MDRRKIILAQVAKYGIFVFAVLVLYVLQCTPGFLKIFGIKPVFIIPFCVTLSMFDDTEWAVIVYVIGGLLSDMSSGRIAGFFTIFLLLACFSGMIAVKFFFKANPRNSVFFSFGAMVLILSLEFFFYVILTGTFSGKAIYYFRTVLLTSAYSAAFSRLFYYFINFIFERFPRFDAR